MNNVLQGGEQTLPQVLGGSVVLHGTVAVGEDHGLEDEKLLLAETDVVEASKQDHALNNQMRRMYDIDI